MEKADLTSHLKRFTKSEAVFCIAALAAAISMLFVPPNAAYLSYVDYKVIAQLFSLMSVTAIFGKSGVLAAVSGAISRRSSGDNPVPAAMSLSFCCFFSAMLITNDVALLTFVPLTVAIFKDDARNCMLLVAIESAAANLGSMATPVGNPQNLFLFSYYNMSIGDFMSAVLPSAALSAVITAAAVLLLIRPRKISNDAESGDTPLQARSAENIAAGQGINKREAALGAVLLIVCVLTVLGVVDWRICLAAVLASLLLFDRAIFKKVDYMLLATFVCFFVFVGNIGSLDIVREFVSKLLTRGVSVISALISQVISNVPAAVMLAPFTTDARALLVGVNVGGLGTLIASLASLIAYRLYARSEGSRKGSYLLAFTAINIAYLIPLAILNAII